MKAFVAIGLIAALIGWAGSHGGVVVAGVPLFAAVVLLAFAIQWLAFVPAYIFQTERYYDLTGSLTYIAVTVLALVVADALDERSVLLALFVILWALRLGSFLFRRILHDGSDSRFDRIKPSPLLFLRTWTLQGLWVAVTAGAALAAITSGAAPPLSPLDALGIGLWLLGFTVETMADQQKRAFRATHGPNAFITTGLWSLSRHPNYAGEITLWTGVALLALPALSGWQYLTLVSPVFVYILLTRVSGVAMLERKSDKRWGDDEKYQAYKASTPVLWPGRRR